MTFRKQVFRRKFTLRSTVGHEHIFHPSLTFTIWTKTMNLMPKILFNLTDVEDRLFIGYKALKLDFQNEDYLRFLSTLIFYKKFRSRLSPESFLVNVSSDFEYIQSFLTFS